MTRKLILVWADSETGEVMNADGTVAGKIVPKEPVAYRIKAGTTDGRPHYSYVSRNLSATYECEPLYAASKVDLSGAAVKLPERFDVDPFEYGDESFKAHNACLDAITATMPKGE